MAAIAAQYHLNPVPLDQFGSRPIYRLRITDGAQIQQRVSQLIADTQRRVVYAEPNYIYKAPEDTGNSWSSGNYWSSGGDAGAYTAQWSPQTIHLATAHQYTRGAGITVAVLDTGVDATHSALKNHLAAGYDFVDMDNDPLEVGSRQQGHYGHGTHVAGLVALVAPEAKIMPVRVLDQNGVGNVWVLAEALAYAVNPDGDIATHDGADVINMSIGTLRHTNSLADLLKKVSSDVPLAGDDDFPSTGTPGVVIAAAGNGGDSTPQYPAAENIGGLFGVGASTQSDTLATFSTRGSWIRVIAPG